MTNIAEKVSHLESFVKEGDNYYSGVEVNNIFYYFLETKNNEWYSKGNLYSQYRPLGIIDGVKKWCIDLTILGTLERIENIFDENDYYHIVELFENPVKVTRQTSQIKPKRIEFKYRPDGDLNEYIGNGKALEILTKYRKGRFREVFEAEEYVFYRRIGKYKLDYDCERDEHGYYTFVKDEIPEKQKEDETQKWIDENQDYYQNQLIRAKKEMKDKNYEIIRSSEDYSYSIISKSENIEVHFSSEMLSSIKEVESNGVWGGVSSDMYRGYIEYKSGGLSDFIGKNALPDDFSFHLKKQNVVFEVEDCPLIESGAMNLGKKYIYQKDEIERFVYEVCVKCAVDDYYMLSVVFSGIEPSYDEVIFYLRGELID